MGRSYRHVEPALAAIGHGRQPDPVQHARFVTPDLKLCIGGRTIHEMQPAGCVLALEKEAPDAVTGKPRQSVLRAV